MGITYRWLFLTSWKWYKSVLMGPHGVKVLYALKFGFKASNNEAEYEALITGLKLAKDVGTKRIRALSDSMLVVQ